MCLFTATVAAVYYSYYMLPDGTYCLAPPPPGVDAATYYSTLPAGVAVSGSAGVTATAPPPPGTTPPPPPSTAETSSGVTSTTITTSALASVAAIIPPPPDIQPVIDKLAEYVARNGLKFETSVRAKNDQRFEFLQPWHQYNAYYEFKKQFFLQKEGGESAQAVSAPEEAPAESAPEKPSDTGEDSVSEDVADAGGRGGSSGKKEAACSKAVPDGKLVKETGSGLRDPGVQGGTPAKVTVASSWGSAFLAGPGASSRGSTPYGLDQRNPFMQYEGGGQKARTTRSIQGAAGPQQGVVGARWASPAWSALRAPVSKRPGIRQTKQHSPLPSSCPLSLRRPRAADVRQNPPRSQLRQGEDEETESHSSCKEAGVQKDTI
ncbi:hypothetical protein J1605_011533 [Eschrichtius robustus]|uniref:Splicing factor, suppressor of white-apricot homolog n=1 Tax=Eschrichtius robustus TaxID=9764 RepID=A0AB34GNF2_ESCRO|nr:hypothetical protein J1605_011533 [Eschrichtius robustus]